MDAHPDVAAIEVIHDPDVTGKFSPTTADAPSAKYELTKAAAKLPHGPSGTPPASASSVHPIEYSFAGRLGKTLAPLTAPLGFDWKLTVGILGAFSAREVFVSTLGLVFGIEDESGEAEPLRERMRAEKRPDGKPAYPPLVGLSLMVFFALACQCMSTLAVVKRETRSWRWPLLLFSYMTLLAYAASFIVYQVGKLLGFAA
jgi:ferrous iron transport protein B